MSWLALVLFCLVAPLALLTGWTRIAVLTTEGYVAIVGSVAADTQVQDAIARGASALVDDAIRGETPTATRVDIADAAVAATADAARDVVASDAFTSLWREANRELHATLILLLDQPYGEPAVLDLSPLLPLIQQELAANQIALPEDVSLADEDLRFELLDAGAADTIRRYADTLDTVSWALLTGVLIALALSIGFARDRLQAIIRAGYGLAIGMALLLIVSLVVQRAAGGAAGPAAGEMLGALLAALTQGLRIATVGLALTGLVIAAVAARLRSRWRAPAHAIGTSQGRGYRDT